MASRTRLRSTETNVSGVPPAHFRCQNVYVSSRQPEVLPRPFWFNSLDQALTPPVQIIDGPPKPLVPEYTATMKYLQPPRKLPVARELYSSLFSTRSRDLQVMPNVQRDVNRDKVESESESETENDHDTHRPPAPHVELTAECSHDTVPKSQPPSTPKRKRRVASRKHAAEDTAASRRREYDRQRWRAKYANLNKDPAAKERFLARRRKRDRDQKRRRYAVMTVEERRAIKQKAKKRATERDANITRFLEGDGHAPTRVDIDAATIANLMSWKPPVSDHSE